MEDVINSRHRIAAALQIADVTDKELNLMSYIREFHLILMTHVILLFLITTKDTDFTDICSQKTIQYSVTKRTCTTCNQQGFVFKN